MDNQVDEYLKLSPYQDLITGIKTALSISEGIIKLIGPAGVGKTSLCNQLTTELEDEGQEVLFFATPPESTEVMHEQIRRSLKLEQEGNFTRALTVYLTNKRANLLIIFDDAEVIDDKTFVSIRLLGNIQNDSQTLIRLILCGSSKLDKKLRAPSYRSLAQYLNQSFKLRPMDKAELDEFCLGYLAKTGHNKQGLDTAGLASIYKQSKGMPGRTLALLDARLILDIHSNELEVDFKDSLDGKKKYPASTVILWSKITLVSLALIIAWMIIIIIKSTAESQPGNNSSISTSPVNNAVDETFTVQNEQIPEEETAEPAEAVEQGSDDFSEDSIVLVGTEETLSETATAIIAAETVVEERLEVPLHTLLADVIAAWATSWQAQDIDAYFTHYHTDFSSTYFESVADWRENRIRRFSAPEFIEISFDRLEIMEMADDSVTVRFWMNYMTPGYADETWKEMRLRFNGSRWLIEIERNLQINRIQ